MTTSTVGTETDREIRESHQLFTAPLSAALDEVVLSDWLNKAEGTASYRRVVGIIENIRKTDELTAQAIKEKAFHRVLRAGKWIKPESGELMTRSEIRNKLR